MSDKVVESQLKELVQWFNHRKATLALAESCTGGRLSSWIAAQPGVSSFFLGSVVSYSNESKRDLLDVPEHLIRSIGAVSLPVASKMAYGARRALHSDWAVSITGIAGPTGGTPEKPVGTVCFALSGPGVESTVMKIFDGGSREAIQQQAAQFALSYLLKTLRS